MFLLHQIISDSALSLTETYNSQKIIIFSSFTLDTL